MAMTKLQFGCGSNQLEGWQNYDRDLDLEKLPLPFRNESADFILLEHTLEHFTMRHAWLLIEDFYRILKPGGAVRIAVPDVERIWFKFTPAYGEAVKVGGHGDGSLTSSVRAAVHEHGHLSVWNQSLLAVFLSCAGFKIQPQRPGKSAHPALVGVEGHWRVVGEEIANIETSCLEGWKV